MPMLIYAAKSSPSGMTTDSCDMYLVAAAKNGDHQAYAELCRRHSRQIFQTVLRITGNISDSEDAFQEALLKAPVSSEYTLIHLYVPFGAFLIFLTRDAAAVHVKIKRSIVLTILTLFALLFSPLTFFGTLSGDVKMCLLTAMLIVVSRNPMPSSIFKEIELGIRESHDPIRWQNSATRERLDALP